MKALTVWQPWTSMIVDRFKPWEFRSWAAPGAIVGQRIVLHAAVRPVKPAELRDIMDYVCSREGTLDGIDPRAMDMLERVWRQELTLPMAAGIGTATLGTPRLIEHRGRDSAGKPVFAWPMIDVEKWSTPVPAKGAQGFWEWRA